MKKPVGWEWDQDNRRCGDGCCSWTESQSFTVYFDDQSRIEVPMPYFGCSRDDAESAANEWLLDHYGMKLEELEEVW